MIKYDSTYIMAVIEWGIVPLILAGILLFSLFSVPDKTVNAKVKVSSLAGKWAGLVVLVLFILSQKGRNLVFSFDIPTYDFAIWPTSLATVGGFILSWFFSIIKRTNVLGLFVFALVATTSITFYSYIFISNIRSKVIFVALGITLGVLLHKVFFPESTMPETTEESGKNDKT